MLVALLKRAARGPALALAVAFLLGGASAARADFTTTLDQLIASGGHTENGLSYTGFTYVATPTGGAVAPAASAITVIFKTVAGLDTLQFVTGAVATTGRTLDLAFGYNVQVVSGLLISDAHLDVTGGVINNGTFSVDDSFPFSGITPISVTNGSPSAFVNFTPRSSLSVSKDAFLNGGSIQGSEARFSVISQGLSRAVPEPASVAMVAVGLVGALGAGVARRRKANA